MMHFIFTTAEVKNDASTVKTEVATAMNEDSEKPGVSPEDDVEIDAAKRAKLIQYGIIPRKRKRPILPAFAKR